MATNAFYREGCYIIYIMYSMYCSIILRGERLAFLGGGGGGYET